MRRFLLAGTLLAGMSVPAAAAVVTWDFSVGTPGDLGPTAVQDSVPGAVPIDLAGFVSVAGHFVTTDLFRKEGDANMPNLKDEKGMGLTQLDHEIVPGSFVQLDLSHVTNKIDFSFSANSTTGPDEWGLWLSNTAGSHGSGTTLTGMDENTHFIDASGFRFLDVGAIHGTVLLHTVDANVIPEPSTWAMMLLGGGFLALFGWRRKNAKGNVAFG
jgi:hypothetical protein